MTSRSRSMSRSWSYKCWPFGKAAKANVYANVTVGKQRSTSILNLRSQKWSQLQAVEYWSINRNSIICTQYVLPNPEAEWPVRHCPVHWHCGRLSSNSMDQWRRGVATGVYIPSQNQSKFYGVEMMSERLLNMSVKVLPPPKYFYTAPKQMSGYTPLQWRSVSS